MITVFSSIIRGEPKTATFTSPFLLAVLRVPIRASLLKSSITSIRFIKSLPLVSFRSPNILSYHVFQSKATP